MRTWAMERTVVAIGLGIPLLATGALVTAQGGGRGERIADAKPGDRDFNGGRWAVYAVTWNVTPWQMTNDGEVLAAAQAGDISISANPVKLFFCNVAIVPPSWD